MALLINRYIFIIIHELSIIKGHLMTNRNLRGQTSEPTCGTNEFHLQLYNYVQLSTTIIQFHSFIQFTQNKAIE